MTSQNTSQYLQSLSLLRHVENHQQVSAGFILDNFMGSCSSSLSSFSHLVTSPRGSLYIPSYIVHQTAGQSTQSYDLRVRWRPNISQHLFCRLRSKLPWPTGSFISVVISKILVSNEPVGRMQISQTKPGGQVTYKTLLQAACGSSGSVKEVKDLLAEMLGGESHHGGALAGTVFCR